MCQRLQAHPCSEVSAILGLVATGANWPPGFQPPHRCAAQAGTALLLCAKSLLSRGPCSVLFRGSPGAHVQQGCGSLAQSSSSLGAF